MSAIDIIEDFAGEELTDDLVSSIIRWPKNQTAQLLSELNIYYSNWLNDESNANSSDDPNFLTYAELNDFQWDQQIEFYKKHLLYFQKVSVVDPLASLVWKMAGFLFTKEETQQMFDYELFPVLGLLRTLRDSVKKGDITLVPFAYAGFQVQDEAREVLNILEKDPDYMKNIMQKLNDNNLNIHFIKSVLDQVQLQGQLCKRLNLAPVATNVVSKAMIEEDYGRNSKLLKVPAQNNRVSSVLFQFEVPGIKKATVSEILNLRNNEAAFAEWRISFGQLMDSTRAEEPKDQAQFLVEFKQKASDILTPKLSAINSALKSSAVEKILMPASVTLGAGFAVYSLTAPETRYPIGSIASASFTSVAWVLDKLNKRFNKSGKKAAILKEFYGFMLSK